ncbi:MAG: pentapeptide repeat-containing protein [Gammaproteobacteria bacterium]|nr:pentapeptide repeat-containing protein [Gammaproteobacteria bacterium]MCW8988259.1 pentapeptide repeat-containing protein [Gammaproteobacteria bacterium]
MADSLKSYNLEEFKSQLIKTHDSSSNLISNFTISNFEYPSDIIKNITIKNTKWKNITANNRIITDVEFEDCALEDINFKNTKFKNITFKNCTLKNVIMNESFIINMVFINCELLGSSSNINNSYIKLKSDTIKFINSSLKNIDFYQSKSHFIFENSKLNDVSGYGLLTDSKITITDSNIYDMDFSNSKLTSIKIKNSIIKDSKINNSTIYTIDSENNIYDSFPITDISMGKSLSSNNDQQLTIGGNIKIIKISNCKGYKDLYLGELDFETIDINNCKTPDFTAFDSTGERMSINGLDAYNLNLNRIKIKQLNLNNISVENKLYNKDAQVNQYNASGITVNKNIKRKSNGANFEIVNTN